VKNINIQQYNLGTIGKNEIYNYMSVNLAHLEDDITRYTRKGYSQTQLQKFFELKKLCITIQDKVTYGVQLSENEIKSFEKIKLYNTAKNTEMKRIAVFTVIIAVVGTIITSLIKL